MAPVSTPPPHAPPRQVGNYRVLAPLGAGAMGTVHIAEHLLMGRRAAIKLLRPEGVAHPEALQRFFNEARAAAMIKHPGIVEIFDCGTTDRGDAYIAMELLEGEDLDRRLARVGRLPVPVAVEIARQLAMAVGQAHARGILHRDLKPSNVFLARCPEGGPDVVKVLDFGLAKLTTNLSEGGLTQTRSGMVIGTPLYMSPEQCRGVVDVDPRSDVYAIGCILHTMLAGRAPFPYETFGPVIAAHLSESPPPLRKLEPSVPAALEALVGKALSKEPERRQSSAAELAAELDALGLGPAPSLLGSVPPSAPHPRPAATPARGPRARRGLLFGAGGLLLAAAGAAGFFALREGTVAQTSADNGSPFRGTAIGAGRAGAGEPRDTRVAVDGLGHATVAWRETDGRRFTLWVVRHTRGQGWGAPMRLDEAEGPEVKGHTVAAGRRGTAVVLWRTEGEQGGAVWSRRFVAGVGWQAPERLVEITPGMKIKNVDVGLDADDTATAIWERETAGERGVWSARRNADEPWRPASRVDREDEGKGKAPVIAVAGRGLAVAMWLQTTEFQKVARVAASRYTPGSGWEAPVIVDTDAPGNPDALKVGLNEQGDSVLAWRHDQKSKVHLIWATAARRGTAWGPQVLMATDTTGQMGFPEAAMLPDGAALLVWRQPKRNVISVWSRLWTADTGWSAPSAVEQEEQEDAHHPELAVDVDGRAALVWQQNSPTQSNLWANLFDPVKKAWGTPVRLETGAEAAEHGRVAIGAGVVVGTWLQSDGTHEHVWGGVLE